ncbi:MAG TPA: hypothetical protein VJT31_37235 [Rugosimonospora sp.]|nr:hypothetical protein [Rugosimonospora sp.]
MVYVDPTADATHDGDPRMIQPVIAWAVTSKATETSTSVIYVTPITPVGPVHDSSHWFLQRPDGMFDVPEFGVYPTLREAADEVREVARFCREALPPVPSAPAHNRVMEAVAP